MKGAISVSSLGKCFKHYPAPHHRLIEWLGLSRHPQHQTRWVLRDLNFRIRPGESVGIIGRNGAGKSTLLKVLTGTTKANEGQVELEGRVAALLELGMGFHPDFSGRQNVFMAGYMLGLQRDEIIRLMPEIEAFAEIGEAIDHPVRTYSSGMQVRLAFSVATAAQPDILIVDEALSVGDAYFQHKCFKRIRRFREQGVTLLFVSHDPLAIKSLCDRAILIEKGGIAMDASPDEIFDYYNALIALDEARADEHGEHIAQQGGQTRSGTGEAKLLDGQILVNGQPATIFTAGTPISLEVDFRIDAPLEELTLGMMIRDRLGNDIFGTNTFHLGLPLPVEPGPTRHRLAFQVPACNLGPGSYSVTLALHSAHTHIGDNYDWWDQAITFQVAERSDYHFAGVAMLEVHPELLPAAPRTSP
jgi:lipopolysaccharide transport system ATP-binding protein